MRASLLPIVCLLSAGVACAADDVPGPAARVAAHWFLSSHKALSLKNARDQTVKDPAYKIFTACVQAVEPEQIESPMQQVLLTRLGDADLQVANRFLETQTGKNYFLRDEISKYQLLGLEPPQPPPPEPTAAEQLAIREFLATPASEKMRVALTSKDGRQPISERITALVEACGAAHQRKSR
jgi:hypothetical protein